MDFHPTKKGNERIAEAVMKKIDLVMQNQKKEY